MARARKKTTKRGAGVTKALARLHEVGLLRDLEATQGKLVEIVEKHFYARKGKLADVVLLAPQSVSELDGLGLAAELHDDPNDGQLAHVVIDGEHLLLRPGQKTHDARAGMFNWLLERLKDPRRFVALETTDFEEPLFLLATPEQAVAVSEVGLENPAAELVPPKRVDPAARAAELAKSLAGFGLSNVKADSSGVVVELSANELEHLVLRLRAGAATDARRSEKIEELYG